MPQATVYLAGDSTVADYPPDRLPMLGWGAKLNTFLHPSVRVVNEAVNGRSSKSFIDEGNLAAIMERIGAGDALLVHFGHNDSKDDPARYTSPWSTFPARRAAAGRPAITVAGAGEAMTHMRKGRSEKFLNRPTSILGLTAGITSMLLWCIFCFMNPYSNGFEFDAAVTTFLLLFVPACLAAVSVLLSKRKFMLVAFIWSLPGSLYLALTPGIFALFGLTSFAYMISYLLMRANKGEYR